MTLTPEYVSSILTDDVLAIWRSIFGDVLDQAPYGAVYPRVSSELQAEKNSLPSQLRELLTRARDEGVYIKPEHIFWEVHTGEELWERPELTRMRGMFKSRPFERVYFYAVDRFARKAFYAELVLDEAKRAHIEADFITQKFEQTPEGRLMRHVAEYVAEKELYALKERTTRGKRERLRDGKPYGSGYPPFGYRWVDGPHERRDRHAGYAVDEATAPVIQRIFREIAQGRGMRAICRDLIRDGIPTPRGKRIWQTATLSKLVHQELYLGEAWANKWVEIKVNGKKRSIPRPREEWVRLANADPPPLVSPELFAVAQEVISTNKKRAARNNGTPEEFLLRGGLLRCGTCGGSMVSRRYPSFRGALHPAGYTIYICHGNKQHGKDLPAEMRAKVKLPNVNARLIDDKVWEIVCSLVNDEDYLKRQLERLQGEDVTAANLAAIDGRLLTVATELSNYAEAIAHAKSALGVTTLTAKIDELADQQKSLQEERERVLSKGAAVAQAKAHVESLRELYGELGPYLERMPYLLRQRTLASLGVTVTIHARVKGDRTPLPDYLYRIDASIPLANVDCDNESLCRFPP